MDKIDKFMGILPEKIRVVVEDLLDRIKRRDFLNLNVRKLKGSSNVFRVRKGKIRIVYEVKKIGKVKLLFVGRKTDKTYKKFLGL